MDMSKFVLVKNLANKDPKKQVFFHIFFWKNLRTAKKRSLVKLEKIGNGHSLEIGKFLGTPPLSDHRFL